MQAKRRDVADLLLEGESRATAARLENAEARVRTLGRELKQTRRELGQALELRDEIRAAVHAMPEAKPWKPPARRADRPECTLGLHLSDWHFGEVVDFEATDGMGVYCRAVARRRVERLGENIIRYAEIQRHGYRIDRLVAFVLGDMIAGELRDEDLRTEECPPPVQAVEVGYLLGDLLRLLSRHFTAIDVHMIGGSNHGRLSKKYEFKQGARNSFDYIVHEIAKARLASCPSVACHHYAGKRKIVDVDGWKIVCCHGDHVRAWMGIPYYGLDRDLKGEAKRQMARMREEIRAGVEVTGGFDYMLAAHWHTPMWGPNGNYLINGSLSGVTELGHGSPTYEPSPPQQCTFLLSPEHGWFNLLPWRLDDMEEDRLLARETRNAEA